MSFIHNVLYRKKRRAGAAWDAGAARRAEAPGEGKEENAPEEYEVVEREILPEKIICPDCGGITLEGLEFCDKCGGELQPPQ